MLGRWNFLLGILDPHFQGRCGMLVSGSLGLWGVTVSAFPRWEAFSEVDHVTGTFWWKKSWTTWDVPLKGLYTLTLCTTTVFFLDLWTINCMYFCSMLLGGTVPIRIPTLMSLMTVKSMRPCWRSLEEPERENQINTRIRVHDDVRWHHSTCLIIGNSLWVSLNRRTLMSCTYKWRYIHIYHILSCILIHLFLLYIISTCNPKDPYFCLERPVVCLCFQSSRPVWTRGWTRKFRCLLEVESVGRCPRTPGTDHIFLVMERPETHLPN